MRKRFIAAVLSLIIASLVIVTPACASEITGFKADGNKITAEIAVDNGTKIDKSKVSATLDGKALATDSVEVAGGSTEYIVMIDTSLSLSNAHFEAQKKAVTSLYNSLGEKDNLILYTFDKSSSKILDGTEKKEDALKKISALKASGQDTAFYDAMVKLTEEAKASKADNVVPIVFSDGVETLDKGAKAKAEKALSECPVSVYGMYPSVESEKDSAALNELLKKSGGSATAFKPDNVESKLETYADKKAADKATLVFTASGDIAANDAAKLSIDLGDGKPVTAQGKVSEWKAETSETEKTTEESSKQAETSETAEATTKQSGGEEGLDLTKILIPAAAALVLLLVVLLIFRKKGGKKPKDEEPEGPDAPESPESPEEEKTEEPEAPAETEPETPAEAQREEPETEAEGESSETEGESEEEPGLTEEEIKAKEEEAAEAERAAKQRAEERAKRRAANLEKAKVAAEARAAMLAQMGSENKEAAEAKAAQTAKDARKAEKEAAAAAKERAKKEKENRKKMKEEGSNFQFYFVDKK